MRSLRSWLRILLVLLGLTTPALAQDPDPAERPILDERSFLTCDGFSRMSLPQQSGFLLGLREGWRTTSSSLDAHASREDMEPFRETLSVGALWMRRMIDHAGVTHGRVLQLTRTRRDAEPDSTVWKAWLDSVREARTAVRGQPTPTQ